ncbi:serine protease [Deinococcus psychrotolerans]|uniref:Serine protease n=1 Tax=Deinococcus psychrotolerans TaxID=2489213 RepID=A0A3G8YCL5_9DEIO|nr:S8 family serine peptidase [Deinococcus psychrotolerans]AZI43129.1 serine protease [Deinococcus psychrotolerans]
MKQLPRALALLGCGLVLLSACTPPSPPVDSVYTLSGKVFAPGAGGVTPLSVQGMHWNAPHVGGQVLLSAQNLSAQNLSPAALSALSGVRTQSLPSAGLTVAYTPAGQTDAEFAATLAANGLAAQPNYRYQALSAPNDPGYPINAGIRVGGALYDQDYLTRINAQSGWDKLEALGKTPVGALTAVLDTGVDTAHEDLAGRLLPGRDFCASLVTDSDGNTNCSGEDSDPSDLTQGSEAGHGTSSAGLIGAATNNGKGIAALTWSGKTILPVKVFGASGANSGATTASLTAGVKYAVAQGAKVINMSLGLVGASTDPALSKAVADAAAADVLLIAAAGNTPNQGLYYPASDPNVMAIGALAKTDALACYSARPAAGQKALDLVAPGGNAGSGTANCYQSSEYDILTLATTAQGRYTLRAGTSEAAPQVSGAAALLRALRPDLSANQVKGILTVTAKKVAGGSLLDVGAAVQAAYTYGGGGGIVVPPKPPVVPLVPYSLRVDAFLGDALAGTATTTGKDAPPIQSVTYRIKNLVAGTYTLKATLTVDNVISNGEATVTISGGDAVRNIQTR